MSFELGLTRWPPLRLARMCCEHASVVVVCPLVLQFVQPVEGDEARSVGRSIGLDVHRDFCEVAIGEEGAVRSAGWIATTPEQLELFAQSLAPSDRVPVEVTGSAREIAASSSRMSPGCRGQPGRYRYPPGQGEDRPPRRAHTGQAARGRRARWRRSPDEWTRVLRWRLGRREQLVRARSRSKNEIHAVLVRRLVVRPPVSDLFGVKGREWLRGLQLPVEESETVAACMRHVEFLDAEIAEVERLVALRRARVRGGPATDDRRASM